MDAEEISKRCVLFKNVPQNTTELQFRHWLDHMQNGAFCANYKDVQAYEEEEQDIRWIVLFNKEQDALDCIETKNIEVRTSTDEVIDLMPDYCSECIVPENWIQTPEDWVSVPKPDEQPFSILGADIKLDPRGSGHFEQSDLESINSEDLFSGNGANSRLSKDLKFEGTGSEEGRFSSGDLFGDGKTGQILSDSVSSSAMFGSGDFSSSLGFGMRGNQTLDNNMSKPEKLTVTDSTGKTVSSEKLVDTGKTENLTKTSTISQENPSSNRTRVGSEKTRPTSFSYVEESSEKTEFAAAPRERQKMEHKYTAQLSPSQPIGPIGPGYPPMYHMYPYPQSPNMQTAEAMQQFQNYGYQYSQAYGTGEGTRQSFFPTMGAPMAQMVPTAVNPHMQPQLGKENLTNIVYVPFPMPAPVAMQAMQGMPIGPVGHGAGAYYPANNPATFGMTPFPQPSQPTPPQPSQPTTEEKMIAIKDQEADDDYITPIDNTYLSPEEGTGSHVQPSVKDKPRASEETRTKDQGQTSKGHTEELETSTGSIEDEFSERFGSTDSKGYLKLPAVGGRDVTDSKGNLEMDKDGKEAIDEHIYSSINEYELIGNKTLNRITTKREKEKPPLPPDVPKRKSSGSLKLSQDKQDQKLSKLIIIDDSKEVGDDIFKEKMIKVEGIPKGVSQNHLELFIESREVSDEEIASIKFMPDKQEAVVEMKYASAVEKILQKQKKIPGGFKLKDKKIWISVYTPPPVDPRKVFIRGMKQGTSTENLQNFIEVCCSSIPTTIEPGLTPGTALLTFDTPPDLEVFKERVKQRSLEDHFLEISEVEVTQSIKVKGYDPVLSHDGLLYYFENTKKSGGGQVERVDYQTDNHMHIVHFLKAEDAVNACKKFKHEFSGVTVSVSLYYPCLDLAPEYKLVIPDPLEVIHLDQHIVRFLKESSPYQLKFEVQMKKCNASVIWPRDNDGILKLVCDVNTMDKKAREKLTNWQDICLQEVDSLCSDLDVNDHIHVAKEVWTGVCERLREITFTEPDMVMLLTKRDDHLIVVFGLKEYVAELSQKIGDIVTDLEQKLVVDKQTITKSKTLKVYQAALLRAIRFPEKSTTSGLSVSMNDRLIEFRGSKREVDECIDRMYQRLKEFARRRVDGYTKAAKDLLFQKETRNFIRKAVNDKKLLCVWDVIKGRELVLYSKTERELDEVINIFMRSLAQTTIPLDLTMTKLTESKDWESHVTRIRNNSEYTGLMNLEMKYGEIQLVGVQSVFQKVYDDVMKFFDLHGDISEVMNVEPGRFLYIIRNRKRELQEIENQYQSLNVRIDRVDKENRKGFKIHGKKDGCRLAISRLQEMVDNIIYKDVTFTMQGFKEFLKQPEGRQKLQNIELSEKCILLPEVLELSERSLSTGMPKEAAACRMGRCSINVMEGDITCLDVDMITNPCYPSLLSSTGLGATVTEKGGFEIQKEFNEHIRRNSSLADAEIFISKAGKLPCKRIIHVAVPSWKGGSNNERTLLRQAVENCLKGASESNCKTLALPVIGTGLFAYPLDVATRNIVEMIKRYLSDPGRSTSIERIYLCDRKSQNVQSFIDGLKSKLGHGEIQVYKDVDSSYSSGSSDGTGSSGSSDDYGTRCPNITVVEGELANQTVDVIVNSTNQNLDLRIGIVSRGLLKAGGDIIQNECMDKYPSGIKIGDVAKTTGGSLRCKQIFHGMLQSWDKGQGPSETVMGSFVQRCLEEADSRKYMSIAFPALGTGNLGFPPDVVASLMFDCIGNFQSKHLKEVKLVVWHGDTSAVKAFNDVEKDFKKQQQFRRRPQSGLFKASADLVQNKGKDFKTAIGNVTVEIIQGDITRQKTGAIVNSVLRELNLSVGRVSKAILDAGGSVIQTECISQKHLIERDGFVVTSPGRLLCQKIIHLKAKRGDQDWERMICRTLCEVENLGLNSVTFPALGTGGRGFSPNRMAKLMMSSFRHYVTSKDYRQCLKSIRIVIYETDMWKLFIDSVTEAPSRTPSVTSKVMGMFRPKKAPVDSVKIDVYIDSASHLENVKMKLEELFTEHKIYPPKLSLEQLEDKEIKLIERKGETRNISVELNHCSGYIKLQGYGNAMNEVQRDIESYLTKLEKDRLLKEASTSVTLPKCWSKMTLKDPMKIEGLSALKMEYIAISNKFRSETGNRRQIIKIERIQNATLFTQYIAHKHQMEQMNKGSQYPVERRLWHGTSPGAIDSINKTGFNRNFNYGSSHGVGVYFAVNASTSLSYCKQDPNGHFHIYYAHVLTGDCCVGSHGLRNPPAKNSQQPWNTYDSTTDSTSSPNFFVIFHDARAYPSYHIEFV